VPPALAAAAAWCWRLIVIGIVVYAVVTIIDRLRLVVLPCAVALLLCALLQPVTDRLRRWMPSLAATWLTMLLALAVLGGVGTFVGIQANDQFPHLVDRIQHTVKQAQHWLVTGPLHLKSSQLQSAIDELLKQLQQQRGKVVNTVFTGATVAGEVIASIVFLFFVTFFLLKDGRGIWAWLIRGCGRHRERFDRAGRAAWETLSQYVHGTVIVALIHSVVIAIVLIIMGVPLVAPLAVIVFFGSFIPIVGILVAGALAVLVVFSVKGGIAALVFLGILILEQQLEGHVLQPLVVGRWVRFHPLAIILAITIGGVVGGIPGAAVAVPTAAVIYRAVPALRDSGEPTPADSPAKPPSLAGGRLRTLGRRRGRPAPEGPSASPATRPEGTRSEDTGSEETRPKKPREEEPPEARPEEPREEESPEARPEEPREEEPRQDGPRPT
jgi:predicted PurR-regulated permease PerM